MTGVIATIPRIQFSSQLGVPLAGGTLHTYLAGTTTPEPTFQDQALTTANPTTITLDATGSCSLWLDPAKSYKFLLKNSLGVTQPGWPIDNISGASNLTALEPTLGQYAKLTALSQPAGSSLMGFLQNGLKAVARTVQDKMRESVSLDDFEGVDPTGVNDSTDGVLAAFAWLAGGNRKLYGSPGASYRVSKSLPLKGNSVTFDGRECVIINAINGAPGVGADPLIALTVGSGNFNKIANFQVQYDQPANKGHTVSIIGNGQSPQVTVVSNVRPNYQVGLGKDRTGAPMAAYTVYAYGAYSVYCDEIYAQNCSGGLFFDTLQKVSVRRCTIDSATNYGMWFDGCASVTVLDMNNLTGCGQGAQAAVYYNDCESFTFRGNRIKGGQGAEIMSGVTPSRSVTIADNHIEVYTPNKNAIYAKSNTDSLSIENNFIKFIGGAGPFNAAVAVDDVGVALVARSAICIRRNRIVVGGAETLSHGVLLTTAADQINGAIVESNTFGGPGVASVITNAVNLACTGTGNRVTNNTIGAPNVTVTNGVVLGVGVTNTIVKDNPTAGTIVNPIVNGGIGTRRYLTQDIVPVLKGKATAGAHTYTTRLGTVRMIDDVVHFTAAIQLSSFDATMNGFAVIELDSTGLGLPKAKNRANQFFSVTVSNEVFNTPASCIGVKAFMQPGTTEVWFAFTMPNAGAVVATHAHVNGSFFVNLTGFYVAG